MEALLNQLNPPQQQAVRTIEGPVLVLAGAGTGKTRVITYRIAYMISQGINPKSILGMTFTNKAAREMRERLAELVPTKQAEQVTLGTFHSFCVKLLRHEIKLLNFLPSFTIADETDMQGLMKQAMAAKGFTKDDISMTDVASYIGKQKNQLIFPPESKKQAENDYVYDMAQIYEEYQNLLELQNMIDFDDMLMLSYKILTQFPEVLEKYRAHYQYLLVDEYQDTNDAQFELIRLLSEPRCNLCVVGDDDQSIYGWRGANVGNILDFPNRFPGAAEIRLEQNYRSTNNILMAANRVISRNTNRFNKSLWSNGGEGDKITLVRTSNAEEEADMIANYIAGTHGENPAVKYSSFAILYRSNHLSRQLEQSLRSAGVPYRLVGGQEFFKRKEIKDAAAYLKLLANPRDDQSLLRILPIPPRGLAEKAVNLMKERKFASRAPMCEILSDEEFHKTLGTRGATSARELTGCMTHYRKVFEEAGELACKVRNFLKDVGYLDGLQKIYKDLDDSLKRRENVDEFINAIAQFEKKNSEPVTLGDFLESFALLEENDRTEDKSQDGDAVTLSTIHAAKGLEYPTVFLPALERDIFPHERAIMEGSTDEELRLFYVAITRAKKQLFITYSRYRMQRGRESQQSPSPFLRLLPEELIEVTPAENLMKKLSAGDLKNAFENICSILNRK